MGALFWSCTIEEGVDDESPSALAGFGEVCESDEDCAAGTCWDRGVCVMSCDAHANCGCPAGTNNGDIMSGKCDVACFDGQCLRVCRSGTKCEGMTVCSDGDLYDVCR